MTKRMSVVATILITLSMLLTIGGQVAAAPNATNGQNRKIIVFQERVSQAAQDEILDRAGAAKIKHLGLVNAAVAMVTPASERALSARAEVLRIEDDAVATILGKPENTGKAPPPQPAEVLPWGIDRIDAELAWSVSSGVGVKVAVIDTGIDLTHPDLATNIKGGINTISPLKSPNDDNGHGTHVAGTIAGIDNGIGVIGVAPGASLYAVKVLGKSGSGWISDIIEGIDWCIANDIDVINMSLGSSSDVQSFHDAIIAAYNSGIVIVAAAGNSGPGDNTSISRRLPRGHRYICHR